MGTIEQLGNRDNMKTYNRYGGILLSDKPQRLNCVSSSSSLGLFFARPAEGAAFDPPVNHNYTTKIPFGFSMVATGRYMKLDVVPAHLVVIQDNHVVRHGIIVFDFEECRALNDVLRPAIV